MGSLARFVVKGAITGSGRPAFCRSFAESFTVRAERISMSATYWFRASPGTDQILWI